MAQFVLKNCGLWLHNRDLRGRSNGLDGSETYPEVRATVSGDAADWSLPGIPSVAFSGSGFMDEPSTDVVRTRLATASALTMCPQTVTPGDVAVFSNVMQFGMDVGGQVGDMYGFTFNAAGQGSPLVSGILMENATVTVTGTGTIRQLGAVAAGQSVYAAVHHTAVSGTLPTIDIKIQSDDAEAFASPIDRITFPQSTAANGQFASTVGPITDTWWRVIWTITGTTPSFAIACSVGIK